MREQPHFLHHTRGKIIIRVHLWPKKVFTGPTPPAARRSARSGVVFQLPPRLVVRVEPVMDFQHSFRKDMGIDLRGGDIGMTQFRPLTLCLCSDKLCIVNLYR